MDRWCRVLAAGDLAPGQGRTVSAGTRRVALFNSDGRYFATDDACPHQGASLASGAVHDGRVICPLHSWVFDLQTGHCPRDSHDPVQTYPTRVVGAMIEVGIPTGAEPGEQTA